MKQHLLPFILLFPRGPEETRVRMRKFNHVSAIFF